MVAMDCDGKRLRRRTLVATGSGGYSDGEGGGPWRRWRAAAMGRVANLCCGREGRAAMESGGDGPGEGCDGEGC